MSHAHTPAEWAAAVSAGVSAVGLIAFAVAFAAADLAYFDPRRPVKRLVESGRLDPLLVEITRLRYTLAAMALAAHLRLAVPNGATQ